MVEKEDRARVVSFPFFPHVLILTFCKRFNIYYYFYSTGDKKRGATSPSFARRKRNKIDKKKARSRVRLQGEKHIVFIVRGRRIKIRLKLGLA